MASNRSDTPLKEIQALIKGGNPAKARAQLIRYVKQHPDEARAWYLLSVVSTKKDEKLSTARKAVTLAPVEARYLKHLDALQSAPSRLRPAYMFVFGLAGLAVVAGLILLLSVVMGSSQGEPALPTLAALADAPATDENAEAGNQVAAASATPEPAVMATSTQDAAVAAEASPTQEDLNQPDELPATATFSSTPDASTGDTSSGATATLPPTRVAASGGTSSEPISTVAQPAQEEPAQEIAPVENTTQPQPAQPSATPQTAATAGPTATPPFPIPSGSGTALNVAGRVNNGDLRVISVTRNAEQTISDLGGTIPNAASGRRWLLLEMLYSCDATCNAAALQYYVVSSGQIYPAETTLRIEPLFGSNQLNNQYWGYLGFTVPTNETNLRLVVRSGQSNSVFALD